MVSISHGCVPFRHSFLSSRAQQTDGNTFNDYGGHESYDDDDPNDDDDDGDDDEDDGDGENHDDDDDDDDDDELEKNN